jgi:glycosyltransferase involved in cell wall biosynthesis
MLKYPIYRWFIPRFDAYLVVGERAKEYYLRYGADEKRIFFVPHSVDNYFFVSRRLTLEPERENLRENWGIPKDSLVFLFAGKLIPKKRPLDFLKALKMACRDVQGIFGLVVGDGPLRAKLEGLSQAANLPILFTGFLNQREMPKAYTASDILVLPSDGRETWGLVVNEAFASGLPAIVSDKVGCVPDLIIPGETGEIFSCGDVKKLTEIFKSYVLNRGRLKEMSKNVKKIIENHSIANSVEGTLRAIQAL